MRKSANLFTARNALHQPNARYPKLRDPLSAAVFGSSYCLQQPRPKHLLRRIAAKLINKSVDAQSALAAALALRDQHEKKGSPRQMSSKPYAFDGNSSHRCTREASLYRQCCM